MFASFSAAALAASNGLRRGVYLLQKKCERSYFFWTHRMPVFSQYATVEAMSKKVEDAGSFCMSYTVNGCGLQFGLSQMIVVFWDSTEICDRLQYIRQRT
jgi:hypothetical protein